ncbi:MAG: hypothetical protein M3Q16_04520 [Pseudomonadota bacterium]|nr:hypothetical protein [Pseudomonadota bacterium]
MTTKVTNENNDTWSDQLDKLYADHFYLGAWAQLASMQEGKLWVLCEQVSPLGKNTVDQGA